jgi:hypothetical protein
MIPFTQYLRPNGRQREVSISRPADIEAKAQRIIDAGFRFEIEELGVPEPLPNVSMTITHPQRGDVAIELCRNGHAVPKTVDKLITEFKL